MPRKLFSLAYFPPISFWAAWRQDGPNALDLSENYQKQSYRNRMCIADPDGRKNLVIPVIHTSGVRKKTHDIEISYAENWPIIHWRTLESAYRSSPYFEFYEDSLKELILKEYKTLGALNLASIRWICDELEFEKDFEALHTYQTAAPTDWDFRDKIHPKKGVQLISPNYHQVFDDRNPFITDLSILDLLFNKGPAAYSFLLDCELSTT